MSQTPCTHWWRVPSPDAKNRTSRCKRCGATRRFPMYPTRGWSPIRLTRQQLREMQENMVAAAEEARGVL